jgi:ankyrin repeat protein
MHCQKTYSLVLAIAMVLTSRNDRAHVPSDKNSATAVNTAPQTSKVEAKSASSVTPLMIAVGGNDEARVRNLLASGANPDDPSGSRSPLILAITTFRPGEKPALVCNVGIVRALLEHGADPNRPDPATGTLPLLAAFDVGDMSCARIIRSAGGRAEGHDQSGRTILICAVGAASRSRNTQILDLAISWGSGPNERTGGGATALHEAVRVNSPEVARALLARGANPCIRNDLGQTPLDMANNLKRSPALIEVLRPVTRCAGNELSK